MIFKLIKKPIIIFGKKNFNIFLVFIFGLLIATILETLSVSLLIPLSTVLINPEFVYLQIAKYNFLNFLLPYSNQVIINIILIIVSLVFLLKFIYMFIFVILKNKFIFQLRDKVVMDLFSSYLSKDYNFFIKNNSSKIISNLKVETDLLVTNVLSAAMELTADVLMVFGFVLVLMFLEPLGTSVLFVIFLLFVIFYRKVLKKKTFQWGNLRESTESEIIKTIQHSLGSFKEIILYDKKNYFLNYLNLYLKKNARSYSSQVSATELPRQIIEIFCIFCFVILFFIMSSKSENYIYLIPKIGFFSVVAFKTLPAINRILSSLQRISFAKPIMNKIYNEKNNLKSFVEKNSKKFLDCSFNDSIEIKNLNFKYKEGPSIFKNLNLLVNKKTILGLKGPSGSGKTSLINIIMGLYLNYSGEILVDNKNIKSLGPNWFKKIAYISQAPYLLNETLLKNIAFGQDEDQIDYERVKSACDFAQLNEFIDNQENGINTIVEDRGSNFSGGQIQRIAIARAVYRRAEIIFFDESTASLDPDVEKKILDTIIQLKKRMCIIIISHSDKVLSICDKVLEIKNKSLMEV